MAGLPIWIDGNELIEEWKTDAVNIIHLITDQKLCINRGNLPVYDKKYRLFEPTLNELFRMKYKSALCNLNYDFLYDINTMPYKEQHEVLKELLFKSEDIKNFEKKYPEVLENKKMALNESEEFLISLQGEYWEINFKKEKKLLKNIKSLQYIIRLLENPNKKFSHRELQTLVAGTEIEINEECSEMNREQLTNEGFQDVMIFDNDLDQHDKDNIKDKVKEIYENYQAKKPGASEQWKKTKIYISTEYGIQAFIINNELKFKCRQRLDADNEKARINVTKNINNGLKKIKETFPILHDYLEGHIKTDGTCRFEIDSTELIDCKIN